MNIVHDGSYERPLTIKCVEVMEQIIISERTQESALINNITPQMSGSC
jgi:hypothetical protein